MLLANAQVARVLGVAQKMADQLTVQEKRLRETNTYELRAFAQEYHTRITTYVQLQL